MSLAVGHTLLIHKLCVRIPLRLCIASVYCILCNFSQVNIKSSKQWDNLDTPKSIKPASIHTDQIQQWYVKDLKVTKKQQVWRRCFQCLHPTLERSTTLRSSSTVMPILKVIFIYVLLCTYVNLLLIHILLTAHNWQKWKREFLTCPSHKIYRIEAVGL